MTPRSVVEEPERLPPCSAAPQNNKSETVFTMAKSKGKGQKPKSVFHVANTKSVKAKNKAKPVLSKLKKINAATSDKVSKVNKAFTELHRDVAQRKKTPAAASKACKISRPTPEAPVDIDDAADLFSQL